MTAPDRRAGLALVAMGLALFAGPAAASVRLSPAVQRELGIATQTMAVAHRAAESDQ